jgi:futalosine hydrolase
MGRLLVVTAVSAERDAVTAGRDPAIGAVDGLEIHRSVTAAGLLDVICGGVGPIDAAVSASCALRAGYDFVLSAGIGGGFDGVDLGSLVVADAVAHADLGSQTGDGFVSMAELGWGAVRFDADSRLTKLIAERTGARRGCILTVSTATGTAARAAELTGLHPDAAAEGMEGVGVQRAAARQGVPFGELRAISNRVGPRNLKAWRIGDALAALTRAFDRLLAQPIRIGVPQ